MRKRTDELLAGMSQQELRELRAKIDFLIKQPTREERNGGQEIYEAVQDALKARGVPSPPYLVFARRSSRFKSFRESAARLDEFVRERLKPRNDQERRRAYDLLVQATLRRLQQGGAPLSLGATLAALPNAPGAIDLDYPGYLESGLLPQVLRHHRRV